MASVEAGSSALTGTITTNLALAGAGITPNSTRSFSERSESSNRIDTGSSTFLTVLTGQTQPPIGGLASLYFKNRGFFVSGAVFETWVSQGAPSTVPPSGHSLINITVVTVWSA